MNKLITNQTPYYTLSQESMLNFPNQELIEELKLQQTDQMQNQLITKVAAKASLMHKSQLTETITDEIVETHKIIRIEPHQKYLIVDIENTTNDKVFSVKVDIPVSLVQNEEGGGPLIVKYNITNTDPGYSLYLYSDGYGQAPFKVSGVDMFSKVEIDGTEIPISDLDNTEGKFRFDSTGEHTVKYTLKDPTFMGTEFNLDYSELLKLGAVFVGCTQITEVIIPDSVVIIGDSAFYNCSNLISVTIGNSVNIIGEQAFYSCYDLTSVNIPSSVTTIKTSAFEVCGLTSVIIPNGVTSIGSLAFQGCSDLTSVVLPDSITNIDEGAFANCDALSQVNIPNSINTLNDIFSGCYSLTSVTIPNSVTTIGNQAFWECISLTSVTIPNSVTSIGNNAFQYCYGLTSVTIPNSVTSIGEGICEQCTNLTSLNVESGNTVYDSRNDCNAIIETATNTLIQGCKSTVIPNTITMIRESAFYYCSGLTSIIIPNNVTTIGDFAFNGCYNLTSVTIGNSVTTIGNLAFQSCENLSSITIEATTPPTLGNYVFDDTNNCPIYVPTESVQAYKTAWSGYQNRIMAA